MFVVSLISDLLLASVTAMVTIAAPDCRWLRSRRCDCLVYLVSLSTDNKIRLQDSRISVHDDVIKWKHFPRYWPFVRGIHRSPVNSPHKGQWRGALMFSLICVWINDWVNNREAGDLRCHSGHYDVNVMDLTHIPHGSPVGEWYGISFVSSRNDLYSTFASSVLQATCCHNWP